MERELGSRGLTAVGRPAAEAFCRAGRRPSAAHPPGRCALWCERAATRPPGSVAGGRGRAPASPCPSATARSSRHSWRFPTHRWTAERVRDGDGERRAGRCSCGSLEDRGVVQSHSPRYTLAGEAPPIPVDTPAWQARMLDTFGVAAEAGALRFPEDADAVLALLDAGARARAVGRRPPPRPRRRCRCDGRRTCRRVGSAGGPCPRRRSRARGSGSHRLGAPPAGLARAVPRRSRARRRRPRTSARAARTARRRGGRGHDPSQPRAARGWRRAAFAERRAQAAASPVAVVRGRGRGARSRHRRRGAHRRRGIERERACRRFHRRSRQRQRPRRRPGVDRQRGRHRSERRIGWGRARHPGGGESPTPGAAGVAPSSFSRLAAARADQRRPDHQRLEHLVATAPPSARVSIGGANAGDFAIAGDECGNRTLPANAPCAVAVTFTPTAIGQRTATVDFADVGNGSPAQVVLTGTGCRGETCSGTVDAPPSDGTTTSPPPSVGGTTPTQATAAQADDNRPDAPSTHRRASANGGQEWVTQSSPVTTSAPISVARPCPAPSGSARGSSSARRSGACPPRSPTSSLPTLLGLR